MHVCVCVGAEWGGGACVHEQRCRDVPVPTWLQSICPTTPLLCVSFSAPAAEGGAKAAVGAAAAAGGKKVSAAVRRMQEALEAQRKAQEEAEAAAEEQRLRVGVG